MKKLLLFILMTAAVSSVWAQSQLSTVRGKTKDGKTIKVEYIQGTVEDVVVSVSYQEVDELKAKNTTLEKSLNGAKSDLDKAKAERDKAKTDLDKTKKELEAEKAKHTATPSTTPDPEITRLNKLVEEKEAKIKELDANITTLGTRIDSLTDVNDKLKKRVSSVAIGGDRVSNDSLNSVIAENKRLKTDLNNSQAQVKTLQQEVIRLSSNPAAGPKSPVIGLSAAFGPLFLTGDGMSDVWAKDFTMGKSFALYFGTARLSESFPLSVEAGVGIGSYKLKAGFQNYETSVSNYLDADGDACTAHYAFTDVNEELNLSYLNIPISLCFGQPVRGRVSAYFKLGLTPSIKIGSSFTGEGKYALNADYVEWGLHLDDIAHLGYGSGFDCYPDATQPELSSFVLWGNVGFGAYVPFGNSPVLLKAGAKLDMMLMSAGESTLNNSMSYNPNTCNLLVGGAKLLCPSVELGLVYSIK